MYDLIIIGGGPGGYVAAERAGKAGLSVALFEKKTWEASASMKAAFPQRPCSIRPSFTGMR